MSCKVDQRRIEASAERPSPTKVGTRRDEGTTRLFGAVLACALAGACTAANPLFDPEAAGTGPGVETNVATSSVETGGADDPGVTSAVDGTGDEGTTVAEGSDTQPVTETDDGPISTTGEIDCPQPPPTDPEAYSPCESGSCSDGGAKCIQGFSGPPVAFPLDVCVPQCRSECDCPAFGNDGASVVCDADLGCVLDCAAGQSCPDGMLCEGELHVCIWPKAYEPCDGRCEGQCLELGGGTHWVCAALNCYDGVSYNSALCPPAGSHRGECVPSPLGAGDEGWCVLPCAAGCPLGMECVGSFCAHPT